MGNNRGFSMFESWAKPNFLLHNSADGHNASHGGAKTPQYIIKCEEIFSSKLEEHGKDCTPCLWVEAGSSRLTTYDSSGELSGNGRTTANDTVVCVKCGSCGPLLQAYMWSGKVLKAISIFRLATIGAKVEIVQELNYTICYIKKYEQNGDTVTFSFNFNDYEDVSNIFNHDGTKAGKVAAKYNFSTMKLDVKT